MFNRKKKEIRIADHLRTQSILETKEELEREKRCCVRCCRVNIVILTLLFYLLLFIIFSFTMLLQ